MNLVVVLVVVLVAMLLTLNGDKKANRTKNINNLLNSIENGLNPQDIIRIGRNYGLNLSNVAYEVQFKGTSLYNFDVVKELFLNEVNREAAAVEENANDFSILIEKSAYSSNVLITIKYLTLTIFYKGFEENAIDIDLIENQAFNSLLQVLKVNRISASLYSQLLECVGTLNVPKIEHYREILYTLKKYNNDRVNQTTLSLQDIKNISSLIDDDVYTDIYYLYNLIDSYIIDRA
ncbi:MAG: hypothetical protein ACRCTC_04690 [Cetobacterium sp.]